MIPSRRDSILFFSVEDFLHRAAELPRLSREDEKFLAAAMTAGDSAARATPVNSYLPMVAAYVRRTPQQIRTPHTVYACIAALEKAVDRFDFLQSGETFAHHLGWALRQCITRCIADQT